MFPLCTGRLVALGLLAQGAGAPLSQLRAQFCPKHAQIGEKPAHSRIFYAFFTRHAMNRNQHVLANPHWQLVSGGGFRVLPARALCGRQKPDISPATEI